MLVLNEIIKNGRKRMGLTQSELAHRAGVSMPSIQNLEAGKTTNPSLELLTKIFEQLGLELKLTPLFADYDFLTSQGLPLMASKEVKLGPLQIERLASELKAAIAAGIRSERETNALIGYAHALTSHYPTFCKRNDLIFLAAFIKKHGSPLSGPQIKLRRIALANLARLL